MRDIGTVLMLLGLLLLVPCGCRDTPPAVEPPGHESKPQVVTEQALDRELTILTEIKGQRRIMTDATFWYDRWELTGGVALGLEHPEPDLLKPGLRVRMRGTLIHVPGQLSGVERPTYIDSYYVFKASHIEPSDHDESRNTVFDLPVVPTVKEPWIDVPCRLRLRSRRPIALDFRNDSDQPITFLVGQGGPPYTVLRGPPRPALQAYFACPLTYVHDCFHARPITLAPGASESVALTYGVPKEFTKPVDAEAIPCVYRTLRTRDLKLFPPLGFRGDAVDGLRCWLRIEQATYLEGEDIHLILTLSNTTDRPIHYVRPAHLRYRWGGNATLEVIDNQGTRLTFGWPYPKVVMPVTLHAESVQAKGMREIDLPILARWSVGEYPDDGWPVPGKYSASVRFSAAGLKTWEDEAAEVNFLGARGVTKLKATGLDFWEGTLKSNTVTFEIVPVSQEGKP